jgi:glycosyltransferase involved in cell wall biosynthesis
MDAGARTLVSCVLVARNRPLLAGQAIWYFLRQDFESRELLIIDNGDQVLGGAVPDDDRVRYVRVPGRRPLGELLNIGYELSAADLIAVWSEGDWIGPHRLSLQVDAVADADACLLTGTLHYRLEEGIVWRSRTRPGPFSTLLDRRARWAESRLPATEREDALLESIVASAPRLVRCAAAGEYVSISHPGDDRLVGSGDAERAAPSELGLVLGWDAGFYVGLRSKRAPQAERVSSKVRLVAPVLVYDGYGSMGEYLALGMSRAGADVAVTPLRVDERGTTEEFQELLRASETPQPGEPTLCLAWWGDRLDRYRSADLFVNTMWESSRVPGDWPGRLARSRAVIVPSTYVADVFRRCGVDAPIEIVAQGVDPDVYHYDHRPDRDGLVTMMVGVFVPRKNVMQGIQAWLSAFEGDRDARLIIKSRFGGARYVSDDPRIDFVDSNETTRGIAHWYHRADVLMALGNEGFGLPLVEGMATGLPVIALDSEGQADVCRDAKGMVLTVAPERWEQVTNPGLGDGGVRAIPSVGEITARLRWVAGHRAEATAMGCAASGWALRHRNVWDMGPAMLDVMERRLSSRRPLRRRPMLCCPDVESAVADCSRHLAGELGHLVVLGDRPRDLSPARVLHVQHEPGLWDDLHLAQLAQEARYAGIPLVVTEHSVEGRARPWEQVATALVVHLPAAAEVLRRRWPQLRVEVLPLGCPGWVEPRIGTLTQTVAVIGRPRSEHGWWSLLDAVRSRPHTRLLAVRRGGDEPEWRSWLDAASGLAVAICEATDARQAAETVAAKADAVVLWHDANPALGTSYEARVAIGSGLPVMTSPASQFEDLGDAVFQARSLSEGLARILEDDGLRNRVVDAAYKFRLANAWSHAADQHRALWGSLACA